MYNQKIQNAWNEKCRLHAEGDKLYAQGEKLYAEGNIQFYDVVISIYGKKCEVKWNGGNAIVDGWEYKEGYIPESCNGKVVEINGKKYELKEIG